MIEAMIAKRYARALLSLAREKKTVDVYATQLKIFDEVLTEHKALLPTLANHYFDLFAKERVIDDIGKILNFDLEVKNFLKLLIHKGRIEIFSFIKDEYFFLANQAMNREPMTVVSAVELPEALYKALKEFFTKKTGKEIIPTKKIDPSVIGGVRVHIGDFIYDDTLKTQIEKMKQRLMA